LTGFTIFFWTAGVRSADYAD